MLKRLPIALLLLAVACAHTQPAPSPIIITGTTIDWAGDAFEAVDAGMRAAHDRHLLSDAQVVAYEAFVARWAAGYKSAAAQWKDARKRLDEPATQQAAAILTGLLTELATWQFVMLGSR